MKTYFLLVMTAMLALGSAAAYAYETSAPVPIHRTTAKRHVVRTVKKPVAAKTAGPAPTATAEKPAASSAK